jgi:hypothetical protein
MNVNRLVQGNADDLGAIKLAWLHARALNFITIQG